MREKWQRDRMHTDEAMAGLPSHLGSFGGPAAARGELPRHVAPVHQAAVQRSRLHKPAPANTAVIF